MKKLIGRLIGMVLLIGAGVYLLNELVVLARRSEEVRTWESTQGTIIKSEVELWKAAKATDRYYYPSITYAYEVNGKRFESDKIALSLHSLMRNRIRQSKLNAVELTQKYPAGAVTRVFFNPKDPSDSLLEPHRPVNITLFWVLGAIFVTLGSLVFLAAISDVKRMRSRGSPDAA